MTNGEEILSKFGEFLIDLIKFFLGGISIIFYFYAIWQGIFKGKWAEGVFYLVFSMSLDNINYNILDRSKDL